LFRVARITRESRDPAIVLYSEKDMATLEIRERAQLLGQDIRAHVVALELHA
jgi:hypothetical protein